jgi:hypothetical protein
MVVGEDAAGETPFDAVIVKEYLPARVGDPERIPVVESSDSPGGKEPLVTEKVGTGYPLAV